MNETKNGLTVPAAALVITISWPQPCRMEVPGPKADERNDHKAMAIILAIDPGTKESGYVVAEYETLRPLRFGKDDNATIIGIIGDVLGTSSDECTVALEMVASYGMPVGHEVFETVRWIGRFEQHISDGFPGTEIRYVYRRDEKLAICHSPKANDATIRRALADRFAYGTRNGGKGTKKEPGFFYGFRADIWQAFAVAVTCHDAIEKEKGRIF